MESWPSVTDENRKDKRPEVKLKRTTLHIPVFEWISQLLCDYMYVFYFSLSHWWKWWSPSNFIQTFSQASQADSQSGLQLLCPLPDPFSSSAVRPSIQPFRQPLSASVSQPRSAIQPLSSSPFPTPDPPLHADLLSCPRMRCSDVPTSAVRLSLF